MQARDLDARDAGHLFRVWIRNFRDGKSVPWSCKSRVPYSASNTHGYSSCNFEPEAFAWSKSQHMKFQDVPGATRYGCPNIILRTGDEPFALLQRVFLFFFSPEGKGEVRNALVRLLPVAVSNSVTCFSRCKGSGSSFQTLSICRHIDLTRNHQRAGTVATLDSREFVTRTM